MSNEELKNRIAGLFSTASFEEGTEWTTATIQPGELLTVMGTLRNDAALFFNYLFCLTCIDWKKHFTIVYHLTSTQYRHNLVIRAKLDRTNPQIETVSHIWRTAEFHEREAYEMFGVQFLNHPDLRLLILPDGWEGKNPMRKDFEDPVNMVKL
jgi:NADH:ubiquinone oxidoreductase subunit C